MNKEVLRTLYLEKRKTLTKVEMERRNFLLQQNTIRFIQNHADKLHWHIYLSISKFNEPDTWPMVRWFLDSPDHHVYSSRTHFKERHLYNCEIKDASQIEMSSIGIPEPLRTDEVNPLIFDVALVPLIAYDINGRRIGYGAGLYDRFLEKVRPDCLKVGLAITPPLDNIDYYNVHDINLDLCITHLGIDQLH